MNDHIFALLLQIYENDKLLHYIDGNDENNSSWMRFICCARHMGEQNLYAFQYNKEIYYRAFATIPAGEELLVWYEDTYPQYMGIPLNITDIGRQLDHSTCKGFSKCTKHLSPVACVQFNYFKYRYATQNNLGIHSLLAVTRLQSFRKISPSFFTKSLRDRLPFPPIRTP